MTPINGNNVRKSISLFETPLELFIILVAVVAIAIVAAIIVVAIKKPKPTTLREAFEETLQELELPAIKGIDTKRAGELKAMDVSTVLDLATASAKDLAQKSGISEKTISKRIVQVRK